jgi:tetratricopeptide (TPR) repeat protein
MNVEKQVPTRRRWLAVVIFLLLVGALAAGFVWQIQRLGVANLYLIGTILVVLGVVAMIVRRTASDDYLRRQFGESGPATWRRTWRGGWGAVLLGVLMIGLQYGFDYFERQTADALTRGGKAHLQKKEYPQAVADFSKAIELDPKSADAYHYRGVAHLQLGEQEQALADLGESLRLNPTDAHVHFNRGVAYSRAGDFDQALADFSEAIRLDPTYAKAYLARSSVYRRMGDEIKAAADRQKAIELDPTLDKPGEGNLVRAEMGRSAAPGSF